MAYVGQYFNLISHSNFVLCWICLFFIFRFSYMFTMFMHVKACFTYMCACVLRSKVDNENHPQWLCHLIHWFVTCQSKPELANILVYLASFLWDLLSWLPMTESPMSSTPTWHLHEFLGSKLGSSFLSLNNLATEPTPQPPEFILIFVVVYTKIIWIHVLLFSNYFILRSLRNTINACFVYLYMLLLNIST